MNLTVSDLLQQLNAGGEDTRIEAKILRQMGQSVLETVCAFANEPGLGGGYLLLGLVRDEATDQYAVVGIRDAEKIQADLASQCASTFNQPIRPTIWTEDIEGKQVIVGFVPEAQPQEKPIYFRNQGLPRGAFRRIGTTDQRCTEDDLLVFYQDHRHGTYDETLVRDADEKDIDPQALIAYRRYRAETNPDAEELGWSDTDLLYALGCASREGERFIPTVGGLLLFGTSLALRRYFPMMRVDYIRVPGREWVSNPDRRFETIEMRGPLIHLIGRIRATILGDLPQAFSLPAGRVQRIDLPAIPDRVIREVVVNAVMHRSYRIHGAVQIIRYANRIEIRNPGHSLVADDQLGDPGSKTRNPKIAAVLHETRFAETKGSGIRVMREMMVEANLSPPTFESNRGRDEFVATLLMHHFLGQDDLAWLARFHHEALSDNEARALIFVRETGAIGNAAYRHLNSVDNATARRELRRLRDMGLLEQKGKGFDTYYVATARLLSPIVPANEALLVGDLIQIPLPDVQSPGLGVQTPGVQPQSPGLISQSPGLESQPPGLSIPADLVVAIAALGGRPAHSTVRVLIQRLCMVQPMRPIEIAEALGRTTDYIQRQYLRPMLRDG